MVQTDKIQNDRNMVKILKWTNFQNAQNLKNVPKCFKMSIIVKLSKSDQNLKMGQSGPNLTSFEMDQIRDEFILANYINNMIISLWLIVYCLIIANSGLRPSFAIYLTLARLRNHSALDSGDVDLISVKKILLSVLGKLMVKQWTF